MLEIVSNSNEGNKKIYIFYEETYYIKIQIYSNRLDIMVVYYRYEKIISKQVKTYNIIKET